MENTTRCAGQAGCSREARQTHPAADDSDPGQAGHRSVGACTADELHTEERRSRTGSVFNRSGLRTQAQSLKISVYVRPGELGVNS